MSYPVGSSNMSKTHGNLTTAQCPHAYLAETGWTATYAPIQSCLNNASTCTGCHLLLQAIEVFKPGWLDRPKTKDASIHINFQDGYAAHLLSGPKIRGPQDRLEGAEVVGSFQLCYRSQVEPMYEDENYASKGEAFKAGPYKQKHHLRAQSLRVVKESFSQAAFERAAMWLAHCLEHDAVCELPNDTFVPSNLIDVGSWDGSVEPRLYKPLLPVPYACLSYCWGSDTEDVLKTTTCNVVTYYHSIPMTKMPPGIQDAITVCRGLRIKYLGVDSLCIVQNDQKAWLKDASQMDQIYLHSRLTIAAFEPASCKSRFLGEQRYGHPEWERHFIANMSLETGEAPLEVFIRPLVDPDTDLEKRWLLDKRGWCLQESLLPNRRLCFNGDEMIWECLCRTVCECGHILRRPQPFRFAQQSMNIKSHILNRKAMPSLVASAPTHYQREGDHVNVYPSHPLPGYRRWRDIVKEFSRRSISRKTDKFNALSGLAKLVRGSLLHDARNQFGQDEHLAGLWKREFHLDLAWMAAPHSGAETTKLSTQARTGKEIGSSVEVGAPSWSWVSADGPIDYEFQYMIDVSPQPSNLMDCVEVESVSCQRELPDDDTSAVLNGRAVLTGNRVRVELVELLSKKDNPNIQKNTDSPNAKIRCRDRYIAYATMDRPAIAAEHSELYCLGLFTWIIPEIWRYERPRGDNERTGMGRETWFLVLRPCPGDEGSFERVGVGACDGNFFENSQRATVKIV